MVVLLVVLMFLFFITLETVASKVEEYKSREDVRFDPELGFIMADGGKKLKNGQDSAPK